MDVIGQLSAERRRGEHGAVVAPRDARPALEGPDRGPVDEEVDAARGDRAGELRHLVLAKFGNNVIKQFAKFCNLLAGSFSAVSKPIIVSAMRS